MLIDYLGLLNKFTNNVFLLQKKIVCKAYKYYKEDFNAIEIIYDFFDDEIQVNIYKTNI